MKGGQMRHFCTVTMGFIAFMAGCCGTHQGAPCAREYAILTRVDAAEPAPISTTSLNIGIGGNVEYLVETDGENAQEAARDPFEDEQRMRMQTAQILRHPDPCGVALYLVGQANILMDRIGTRLEADALPETWQMEHVERLLKQAGEKTEEIAPEASDMRDVASEYRQRSARRYDSLREKYDQLRQRP